MCGRSVARPGPWLRGPLGEWKVRRLLRRHGAEAMHDVLLPRPDGAGWTQVARQLRLLQRRDRFGPTWESRVAGAWQRIQEATSTRLRDRLHHEAAIARRRGRRPRLAPGLGLALAGGALLGLFLAG